MHHHHRTWYTMAAATPMPTHAAATTAHAMATAAQSAMSPAEGTIGIVTTRQARWDQSVR